MGWKSRFFCDFVKLWPLGWKSGFFCDFVGFWPLKKCSICFLAPTLLDTVGFEVAPKGRPGGIRASDLRGTVAKLPSGTSPGLPQIPKSKIQNPQNPKSPKSPKSKIPKIPQNPKSPKSQNPKSKIPKIQNPSFFGRILGILDLGFCIIRKQFFTWGPQRPKFWISAEDFGFWGFWILGSLDFGFWGRNPKSKIQNPQNPAKKAWILGILGILDFGDFGFWDFGDFGILGILDFRDFGDFGFWIFGTLCSRSLCAKFGFWNLGILDFGFWGSWILDFGLGILDGHLVTKFWMLHKKRRLCTPNRVGGFGEDSNVD